MKMSALAQNGLQWLIESTSALAALPGTEKKVEERNALIDWINQNAIDSDPVEIEYNKLLQGWPLDILKEVIASREKEISWLEMMKKAELCYCGEFPILHAEIEDFKHPELAKNFYCECKKCGIMELGDSEENAIIAWNKTLLEG